MKATRPARRSHSITISQPPMIGGPLPPHANEIGLLVAETKNVLDEISARLDSLAMKLEPILAVPENGGGKALASPPGPMQLSPLGEQLGDTRRSLGTIAHRLQLLESQIAL